jgi:hypothetical protein
MRPLCVITTHFNFFHNAYMAANYRRFREAIISEGLPLLTVEAALGDAPFVLEGDDILRVRTQSILWQKERLINVALDHLGGLYKHVAWIDNDLLLTPGWSEEAMRLLSNMKAVQLFSQIHYLGRPGWIEDAMDGVVADMKRGREIVDAKKWSNPGGAWACHRDILDGLGVYDAMISGGNDTLWAASACGVGDRRANFFNDAMESHYRPWADEMAKRHRHRVTYLDASCRHLYHGEIHGRLYGKRGDVPKESGFDPSADLTIGPDGAYEWASQKPDLHRRVKGFFMRYGRVPAL